ncbi:serine hydrolase [Flavobacteriaceae bacterium R38]|nr:serine hydrolase [Flavobacteriaceae bacterium R38]
MKRNQLKFIVIYTLCIFISQTKILQAQKNKANLSIEEQIDKLFSKWNTPDNPGAAIAVIKDGKTIYTKGYGSANLEYQIPIQPNTVFHAASLSKQFTVFSILLLQEDGKLSLDDDVRQYIPELPDFGKKITLRNLANHSSGLRDQWRLLEMAGWRLDDVITMEHILSLVQRQKALNFDPGEKNMYSNTGFTLLAEIVARVSEKTFSEFTRERIFSPLGMKNTLFYDDHEKIVKNRAYSYSKHKNGYKKSVLSFANVGPTSLFTTAEDFALWALNFENPKVGDADIIDQMNSRTVLNNGNETGYALGQFIGIYRGINVIVHSGSDAGYRAYFARIPDHNMAIVVLANEASSNPIEKVFGVADLFLNEFYEEENNKRKTFKHKSKIFKKLNRKQLERFTGKYWEPEEWYTRNIIIENDSLVYSRPGGNDTKLAPISENEFKMIGDSENVSVIFNKNNQGEDRMQVIINDRDPINFYAYNPVNLKEYTGSYYSEELETSYSLAIKNGKLIIQHLRLKGVELKPIKNNLFISDNRNFNQVEFIRNKAGDVTAFSVSNSGVEGLKFNKISSKTE